MGVKGVGERGRGTWKEGAGDRGRGGGGKEIFGAGILLILLYFYVLQCNKWVSVVSNRRHHIIIIIRFLINVQVQEQHPHQWAPSR